MPDREELYAELIELSDRLDEIKQKLASDEAQTEPATARAAKRWGLAAAIGLLGAGIWALTRTGGQYATAALLGTAAVIGAVIVLAPEPSPPLPGGLPATVPSGATSTTSTSTSTSPTTLAPTSSTADEADPDVATESGITTNTSVADNTTPVPSPQTPPPRKSLLDRDDEEGEQGRDRNRRGGDDADEKRTRCLNVPSRPAVDINACLSAVGDLATAGR